MLKAALPLTSSGALPLPLPSCRPVRATFAAQSRGAGLTKVGVQLSPLPSQQQAQGGQQPYVLDVQPLKRRFRVMAQYEP